MTARYQFKQGVRAIAPLLPSLVPFGIILGLAAVNAGIPTDLAIAMSSIIYAGAAQFAAISLLDTNTPLAVILVTITVINLRFIIYSTSLAPHFSPFSPRRQLLAAYFVSDHSYAAAIPSLTADTRSPRQRLWFYLGVAIPPWILWQLSTAIGVVFGTRLPTLESLEFTIPLAFIGLLFATIENRVSAIVAVAAGSAEAVATALPYNLGLIVGTLCGVGVGVIVHRRHPGSRVED